MKEPSAKRKRTLALHDRALRFSAGVNACCPSQFTNLPSKVVWNQLVRAADSTSNNLIEADDATSAADFLSKMGLALREVKESRARSSSLGSEISTIFRKRLSRAWSQKRLSLPQSSRRSF